MFGRKCAIIGVVHVHPLPGAAGFGSMDELVEHALREARMYMNGDVDALLVENTHDVPYLKGRVEPETQAAVTVIAQAVKRECNLPLGVQILAGANLESLGVAVACQLDFIRVEGYVYAHVGDEGIHEATAAQLIRRRAALRADHIKIFADIKKKHSAHAITGDVSLSETAHDAEFCKVDGVIVSGIATGRPPHPDDVAAVKAAVSTASVLVGSGVTADNVQAFMPHADALIVGSSMKAGGYWGNDVDAERVRQFMKAAREPAC